MLTSTDHCPSLLTVSLIASSVFYSKSFFLVAEVLLKVLRVGICGSDVHIWQNGEIRGFFVQQPQVIGHESCAQVMAVGPNVTNIAAGDIVSIEPQIPCQDCSLCRSGMYNLCPKVTFHGCPPVYGSLSRFIKHHASFCYKLPRGMSPEEGALLEPLSVAVYACQKAAISVGQSVLICGSGPIGLLTLMVAKAFGALHACLTDISESRLEAAKGMGADSIVLTKLHEDPQTVANRAVAAIGKDADVTIDCVGIESTVFIGIHATKVGGVLVNVGCGSLKVTIPLQAASRKEIDFKGVFRYRNTWPLAIQLVAEKKVDVKRLITHKFKLEEALEAFEVAKSGYGIKVMLDLDS